MHRCEAWVLLEGDFHRGGTEQRIHRDLTAQSAIAVEDQARAGDPPPRIAMISTFEGIRQIGAILHAKGSVSDER